MPVKMIITDLDGTLLRSDDSISIKTIEQFQRVRKLGILPVIATGRMESECGYILDSIGAKDYMISMNGGRIIDFKNNQDIYIHHLNHHWIKEIITYLEKREEAFFQTYIDNQSVCSPKSYNKMAHSNLSDQYLADFLDKQIVVEDIYDYIVKNNLQVDKFFIGTDEHSEAISIKNRFSSYQDINVIISKYSSVEIIPSGINKGIAAAILCNYLCIDPADVLAIGDSENDIELLKYVGIGIAVDNAFDHVKKVCQYVVSSNDKDGVAEAIQNYIIKKHA